MALRRAPLKNYNFLNSYCFSSQAYEEKENRDTMLFYSFYYLIMCQIKNNLLSRYFSLRIISRMYLSSNKQVVTPQEIELPHYAHCILLNIF